MVQSPPPAPSTRQLLPGLTFVEEADGTWRIELATISVLETTLGREILVGFCGCFAAFDRLMALTDAMGLNDEHINRDTVRGTRNFHALALLAAGLVYEFREGIQRLAEADLPAKLTDVGRIRWERLREHCTLQEEAAICQIRNCLAFHLGEPKVVRRGLARLQEESRKLVVVRADHSSVGVGHRQYDFASDVLLAGINVDGNPLDDKRLAAAYDEIAKGHWSILGRLEDIFLDALQNAGADIAPLQLNLADADPPSDRDERALRDDELATLKA